MLPAQMTHDAVAAVVGLEPPHVRDQLIGKVLLVLALLDVRTVETLHVLAVEHGRHRFDGGEFVFHLFEQLLLEHAGVLRRLVAVVFENIPAAKHDVVESGQRHELADQRRAAVGALSEPHGPHLGQRADWFRETLSNGEDAGDGGCADGTKSDEQDAKLTFGRSDFKRCGHDEKLYH